MIERRLALHALNTELSLALHNCASAAQALDFASDQLARVLQGDAVLLRAPWALRAIVLAVDLPANLDAIEARAPALTALLASAAAIINAAAPGLRDAPAERDAAFQAAAGLIDIVRRERAPNGYSLDDFLDQVDRTGILVHALDAEHRWQMIQSRRGRVDAKAPPVTLH